MAVHEGAPCWQRRGSRELDSHYSAGACSFCNWRRRGRRLHAFEARGSEGEAVSKTNDLMALADAWAMSAYADGKKNDGTLASHKSCVCVVVLRAAIEQALADARTAEEFKAIARKHRRAAQAGIAAQAATTPLTDDAIADVVSSFDGNEDWNLHDFARAVLAAQEARNV